MQDCNSSDLNTTMYTGTTNKAGPNFLKICPETIYFLNIQYKSFSLQSQIQIAKLNISVTTQL